jgi:ABC-type cobalamin/Fe3+-siderophores transport system ATPase subunit
LLRAADVTFGYGERTVLDRVSFDVPSGGFAGIIGPNGSGKTTLLRLLAGTRRPQRGAITIDGRELAMVPRLALARRMAVVPQETHLAFEYSVLEVALMGRYPHLGPFAIEGPADTEIARQALASTGTLSLEHRAFSTLSGGEKQRVIIASALAQIGSVGPWVRGSVGPEVRGSVGPEVRGSVGPEVRGSVGPEVRGSVGPEVRGAVGPEVRGAVGPEVRESVGPEVRGSVGPEVRGSVSPEVTGAAGSVVLLDEPTAALDLKYQIEIGGLLRELHARHGLTIVLSTHDLNFAAALCDTLVMLKEGRVLGRGTVSEVLTPDNVRRLYDIEADVTIHPRSGHLTVVPLRTLGDRR